MIHDLTTQKGRNAYMKAMETPKDTVDKYTISIEVRDENGKFISDENGIKQTNISYEVEMLKSNMEFNMRLLARTLKTWMPNRKIDIEVLVFNSISRTYMTMFSFYVDEDRFVKH
jgi:hypothetical protein